MFETGDVPNSFSQLIEPGNDQEPPLIEKGDIKKGGQYLKLLARWIGFSRLENITECISRIELLKKYEQKSENKDNPETLKPTLIDSPSGVLQLASNINEEVARLHDVDLKKISEAFMLIIKQVDVSASKRVGEGYFSSYVAIVALHAFFKKFDVTSENNREQRLLEHICAQTNIAKNDSLPHYLTDTNFIQNLFLQTENGKLPFYDDSHFVAEHVGLATEEYVLMHIIAWLFDNKLTEILSLDVQALLREDGLLAFFSGKEKKLVRQALSSARNIDTQKDTPELFRHYDTYKKFPIDKMGISQDKKNRLQQLLVETMPYDPYLQIKGSTLTLYKGIMGYDKKTIRVGGKAKKNNYTQRTYLTGGGIDYGLKGSEVAHALFGYTKHSRFLSWSSQKSVAESYSGNDGHVVEIGVDLKNSDWESIRTLFLQELLPIEETAAALGHDLNDDETFETALENLKNAINSGEYLLAVSVTNGALNEVS
ncbi:MAG: hypothetical protein H6774_04840 [Pseudomonadales bacterium]|nr:hypothetical protein [Pseudomonadales bacterium]